MPVTVDEFLTRAPALKKFFSPAPDLKRRTSMPKGDEADRLRFLRDLDVQIGFARGFQAADIAAGRSVPSMPERKGRKGARKFWFIIRDDRIYVQLYLGNLGLLSCFMETATWAELIEGLGAMKEPVKEGEFDGLFQRVRVESRERRQKKLESKSETVASNADEDPPIKADSDGMHGEHTVPATVEANTVAPPVTEELPEAAKEEPRKPRRTATGKGQGRRGAPSKK